jgi:hypothetical protein
LLEKRVVEEFGVNQLGVARLDYLKRCTQAFGEGCAFLGIFEQVITQTAQKISRRTYNEVNQESHASPIWTLTRSWSRRKVNACSC